MAIAGGGARRDEPMDGRMGGLLDQQTDREKDRRGARGDRLILIVFLLLVVQTLERMKVGRAGVTGAALPKTTKFLCQRKRLLA